MLSLLNLTPRGHLYTHHGDTALSLYMCVCDALTYVSHIYSMEYNAFAAYCHPLAISPFERRINHARDSIRCDLTIAVEVCFDIVPLSSSTPISIHCRSCGVIQISAHKNTTTPREASPQPRRGVSLSLSRSIGF